MSRIRDGSLYTRSQTQLDLEASPLIDPPIRQKTLPERIRAYGHKRIAIDALIFAVKLGILIGLAELIAYVFMTRYCGFLFRCGCTWSFAGGASKCNIHNPNGPHCPWCAAKFPASIAVAPLAKTTFIVMYFMFEWFKWPHFKRIWLKLLISVASFFFYGLVSAAVFKIATGYPYFLID